MPENIFEAEWRECLEAHYMHVIRNRDKVTEPSLTHVMHQAGFNDSELAELRVRATMHVDDSGADFVPDIQVLEAVEEAQVFAAMPDAPPAEAAVKSVAEIPVEDVISKPEAEHITDELIEEIEEAADEAEQMAEEPPPPDVPDEDAPQQLSLF
ncbi:MAG: hypothetical protein K8I30_05825 [Anaerolineae bacterium]|nr:hypothetical protein [Anaerolineae bacterium]